MMKLQVLGEVVCLLVCLFVLCIRCPACHVHSTYYVLVTSSGWVEWGEVYLLYIYTTLGKCVRSSDRYGYTKVSLGIGKSVRYLLDTTYSAVVPQYLVHRYLVSGYLISAYRGGDGSSNLTPSNPLVHYIRM